MCEKMRLRIREEVGKREKKGTGREGRGVVAGCRWWVVGVT